MNEIKHHPLFEKEYDFLANAKMNIETKKLSFDVLSREYLALTNHFECLLSNFVKVMKIGNINERKLYRWH